MRLQALLGQDRKTNTHHNSNNLTKEDYLMLFNVFYIDAQSITHQLYVYSDGARLKFKIDSLNLKLQRLLRQHLHIRR